MHRLCVIPARGGSKRLPRKNIIDFRGKPIICYTIEAAQTADRFDRILVSTEDEEIAWVAAGFGAEIDRRNPDLATDTATVTQVLLDLLDREEAAGRPYDLISCLFATAPLRGADDVRAVVDLVVPGQCDFAVAVTDYDLPPHQAMRLEADGSLQPLFPDLIDTRMSDLGTVRVDNGSTYAASVPRFREHRHFFGPGCRGHAMPRARSCDIDVEEDLLLARWYAARLSGEPT